MKVLKKELVEKRFSLLDESKKLFESRFYDAFFVNEYGRLEAVRSERYGMPFSIIIMHVDSFNSAAGPLTKKDLLDFLKKLVNTVLKVVRNCDVTGMLEDKRIIVILPHTDYFGSLITIKKLKKGLEFLTTKGEPYASIIFAQATYPRDGKTYTEMVKVATSRIGDIKNSLWERLSLRDKLFWEIVATLTSGSHSEHEYVNFEMGEGMPLGEGFINRINQMILHEIRKNPKRRGILYMGIKSIAKDTPLRDTLNMLGKTATKIFLVGEKKEPGFDIKNVTTIALNDSRLSEAYITLFMSEDSAYGLLCREGWQGVYSCFHTSDPYLVEGLITRFQRDYELQETF